MGNVELYILWVVVGSMFLFASVYNFIVGRIVGGGVAVLLGWMFMSLAIVCGMSAFIRSGQGLVEPGLVVYVQRAVFFVVGLQGCAVSVMLGRSYNGRVSKHMSMGGQVRKLRGDIVRGSG